MNKLQLIYTTLITSCLTTLVIGATWLTVSWATTANAAQPVSDNLTYVSVPAVAFQPLDRQTTFDLDLTTQMLTANRTTSLTRTARFVAPLSLPNRSRLLYATLYGQDVTLLGSLQMRLKRCQLAQGQCVTLLEAESSDASVAGAVEIDSPNITKEIVDNALYSYWIEVDLATTTAIGLRAVRLTLAANQPADAVASDIGQWELTGTARVFRLPNPDGNFLQARICTNDLSYLDNPTHYPSLVIDDVEVVPLFSNQCVIVEGSNIELRRSLNAGQSSGTYQFIP